MLYEVITIVSGKFVFSASEAYLIEKGKITAPVKGVTLIGNGPEIMNRVSMIGNDWALDDGVGTCGVITSYSIHYTKLYEWAINSGLFVGNTSGRRRLMSLPCLCRTQKSSGEK